MQAWFIYISLILLVFPARETGFAGATRYYLYSCPLISSASILSSSNGKDCRRGRDIRYGIRHTYIQIGSRCYDWGDWNYPRESSCFGRTMSCCVQERRLESRGYTRCADRIDDFESAWKRDGNRYHLYYNNCQVYSTKMIEFLRTCRVDSPFQ